MFKIVQSKKQPERTLLITDHPTLATLMVEQNENPNVLIWGVAAATRETAIGLRRGLENQHGIKSTVRFDGQSQNFGPNPTQIWYIDPIR